MRLGRRDEAADVLARLEAAAEACERRAALAASARCRGLLAPDDSFAGHFEEAVASYESQPLGFERARTRLANGERLRRAGSRRAARIQLRGAFEELEAIGAFAWVERARAELRATGETVDARR